jgi:hypothetical protein
MLRQNDLRLLLLRLLQNSRQRPLCLRQLLRRPPPSQLLIHRFQKQLQPQQLQQTHIQTQQLLQQLNLPQLLRLLTHLLLLRLLTHLLLLRLLHLHLMRLRLRLPQNNLLRLQQQMLPVVLRSLPPRQPLILHLLTKPLQMLPRLMPLLLMMMRLPLLRLLTPHYLPQQRMLPMLPMLRQLMLWRKFDSSVRREGLMRPELLL